MNHDDKFQQRWEFRRGEVEVDSSSDDNSSGDPTVKKLKFCTDIVLPENDDVIIDTPICKPDDKINETDIKKKKKKNVVKKKKPKKCLVNEHKRKKKVNPEDIVISISKDLKMFGDSLIDELKIAREKMIAHMRDEMKKLIDSRPNVKKKTKPRARKATNEGEKSRPSTKTRAISAVGSDKAMVSSSSYLTLPTVLPKPQFENQKNSFTPLNPLNYHQFGSFSNLGQKPNIGFPGPLHQVSDNSSNFSTLSYNENSFLNNTKVDPRLNSNVGFSSGKSDEEFVGRIARTQPWPVLPTNFRNKE